MKIFNCENLKPYNIPCLGYDKTTDNSYLLQTPSTYVYQAN